MSFAGLHESILNAPSTQVPDAYKQVLASLYSPEALTYRRQMGMIGEEAAMAVLCQEMIDSRASGVIQTLSLESSQPDCLAIYAAFGLGRTVVEGTGFLRPLRCGKGLSSQDRFQTNRKKEVIC